MELKFKYDEKSWQMENIDKMNIIHPVDNLVTWVSELQFKHPVCVETPCSQYGWVVAMSRCQNYNSNTLYVYKHPVASIAGL